MKPSKSELKDLSRDIKRVGEKIENMQTPSKSRSRSKENKTPLEGSGEGELKTARLPESTDKKGRQLQYDPADYKGKIQDESEKQKFKFYPDSYKGKVQDEIARESDEKEGVGC